MICGTADTKRMLPAWEALTVSIFVSVTGAVVPAVAVMKTGPEFVALAVKVTDAIPFTVKAVADDSWPGAVPVESCVKVTVVPSLTGWFAAFRTDAVIVVFWPFTRLGFTMVSEMLAGSLVMLIDAVLDSAPDVAEIVTTPDDDPV